MRKSLLALFFMLFLLPVRMEAQFLTGESDPARIHWKQAQWPHFRVVFPEGLDSLANVYGNMLERYRIPVSTSTGLTAGGYYKVKTPAILHPYNGDSNAMVAWSPKRMEFYTLGMTYDTEALPWELNLATHETRHLSQMMLGYRGIFTPLHWITGDLLPIMVSGVFAPSYLLEGDAVVSETGLTDRGRGRDGDFLNYYHSAFDAGIYRTWPAWRFGSWRHYAPNYYALGYLTIAGTRAFYDDPLFMKNVYSRIWHQPIRFNTIRREVRTAAGTKKYRPAWNGIVENFQRNWDESAELRGPFTNSEFVTDVPSWYENYSKGFFVGDDFYVVRNGLVRATTLSQVNPDGSVTDIRPLSGSTSDLCYDPVRDRIYWSETITDERWTLEATSRVRYFDLTSKKSFKPHTLTTKNRIYSPAPSPDGTLLAAVDYPYMGGTALVVLDADSGKEIERITAPAGLQLTIPAWYGNDIVVTGLSDDGMGIYKAENGSLSELVAPVKAKINGLGTSAGHLMFSSDRTGVNEMYEYSDGEVRQLTSTRYGAYDGVFHGDTLYYVTQETGISLGKKKKYGEGALLHKAAAKNLLYAKVDFQQVTPDEVADKLSAQEKALGSVPAEWNDITPAAKPYRKLTHIPRFHSWAPLSVQYDDFSDLNFDMLQDAASIGATAYYQNDLGTASGYVSYGYNPKPTVQDGAWENRHNGHFKFSYTGLYPAFDVTVHVGERAASNYYRTESDYKGMKISGVSHSYADRPYVDANFRMYIPFRFNSNGWMRGVTPTVQYRLTNDKYRKSPVVVDYDSSLSGDISMHPEFIGIESTDAVLMHSITAAVAGYIVRPSSGSMAYPRLGIGSQIGYHQRIGLGDIYSAAAYAYVYGYLPGITRSQGLKLTARLQHTFDSFYCENIIDTQPRGFVKSELSNVLSSTGDQFRITADYVIQFGLPEKQLLSSLFHLTHVSVVPHFDLSAFNYATNGSDAYKPGALYTAGVDISIHSNNLFWFPTPSSLGVTINYNGGSCFAALSDAGYDLPRFYVGLIKDVNF